MDQKDIRVTQVKPFQWRELKTIRLEALRTEPQAFGATYEDTLAWPDAYWQHRIANPDSVHLIARAGRGPIGMVGTFLGPNDGTQDVAIIFGMYVTKEYRGRGAGRQLLGTLFDHIVARYPEVRTLRLWVTPSQTAAARLYEAMGFRVVDQAEPPAHAVDPSLPEIMMERPVRRDQGNERA